MTGTGPVGLRILGWGCVAVGGAALVASAWSYAWLARGGMLDRAYLRRRGWLDGLLLAAWAGVFAGGIGLLLRRGWGAPALQAGGLAILAWAAFSAAARIHVAWTMGREVPVRRGAAVAGNLAPLLVLAALLFWIFRYLGRVGA